MKKLLIQGAAVLFALSLLMSFAACGKDKQDTTTGIPTTAAQMTTIPVTEPAASPVSVEMLKLALINSGSGEWDGNYASLTGEQKLAITDYFNLAGKTVQFRDDNAYFVDGTVETTTVPNDETSTSATTKVSASTTKAAAISVTGLTVTPATLNLSIGGSMALTTTVLPSTAKNKTVTWKSENDKVASVDASGMVVAKSNGTAKIVCTANGGTGVSAECMVTVTTAPTGAVLFYVYNEDEGFFFIENDPWQRNFGFNRLYDWAAPITQMFYSTVRVRFSYGGQDWMIQMWKGQYGYAFVGSEIGIYTREAGKYARTNLDHYQCASDADSLKMQMSLYKKDKWLFTRTYETYWWITGFVPGVLDKFADRTELTMLALITLKDATMKDAFVTALEWVGFTNGGYDGFSTPDCFKVEGNSVYFNWKAVGHTTPKPSTTVPATTETTTESP